MIGDRNAVVGNHVTFWGAQWARLNSLSNGAAPRSFKGFADSTSPNPPTCGGTWASDPGNSSGPPSSIPPFITVIAASSITQSGSEITGNIPEMVLIRTDPGYEPNPGHAGTGTVLSVGCHTQPSQAINLSTRMRVQTGDNVGIGGFIITGSAPKHVLLRAIGPSLTQFGVPNALADPVLELHGSGAFVALTDDNWRDDPAQEAAILATGIPPTNDLESAIDTTLNPGAYTALVRGKNNTSGVALIEVYDLSQVVPAKLANISTRALVSTGDNIVIVGFLLSDNTSADRIIVRGIGPSLAAGSFPVSAVLADPTLELRDTNGMLLSTNNDWQDDPAQAAEITAAGLAPSSNLESAIAATLPPGLYTALLAGVNNGTGVGLVEVYDLGP